MQLVATREAVQLTGLSSATLREWTSRRALIPADIPPKNQGSPARYGWQTILLLRLAVVLRDRFHLGLQAHRSLFAGLKIGLSGTSFIVLWGKALVLQGDGRWSLVDEMDNTPSREDVIIIRLQAHLEALSRGLSLPPELSSLRQLELFPAHPVDSLPPVASESAGDRPCLSIRRKSA